MGISNEDIVLQSILLSVKLLLAYYTIASDIFYVFSLKNRIPMLKDVMVFCLFQALIIQILSWSILISKIKLSANIAQVTLSIKQEARMTHYLKRFMGMYLELSLRYLWQMLLNFPLAFLISILQCKIE